ncbi:hypothetical protein CPC08DRAFT_778594 [Agrocybe pediades]|nr:hypothetical protein CPC08DRAFT_778594 [Agrocybe pediades]
MDIALKDTTATSRPNTLKLKPWGNATTVTRPQLSFKSIMEEEKQKSEVGKNTRVARTGPNERNTKPQNTSPRETALNRDDHTRQRGSDVDLARVQSLAEISARATRVIQRLEAQAQAREAGQRITTSPAFYPGNFSVARDSSDQYRSQGPLIPLIDTVLSKMCMESPGQAARRRCNVGYSNVLVDTLPRILPPKAHFC